MIPQENVLACALSVRLVLLETKEDFAELFSVTGIDGIVSAHFFLNENEKVSDLKTFLKTGLLPTVQELPPQEISEEND